MAGKEVHNVTNKWRERAGELLPYCTLNDWWDNESQVDEQVGTIWERGQVGAGVEWPGLMGKSEGIWWTGGEWQVWERSSERHGRPGGSEKLLEAGREGEERGLGKIKNKKKKTTEAVGMTQSLREYCTTNCLPNRISSQGEETFIQGAVPSEK